MFGPDVSAGVRANYLSIHRAFSQMRPDDIRQRAEALTSGYLEQGVTFAFAGFEPPNGVRCHVSGIDLVRDAGGEFRVLEDNVRVPSGVSYVMTNRRALSATLPEVFAEYRIRPVSQYSHNLLLALRAAAPQ